MEKIKKIYETKIIKIMQSNFSEDDYGFELVKEFKLLGNEAFHFAIEEGIFSPEFFVTGNKHQHVCTIYCDKLNLSVSIFCDGRMEYWDKYDRFFMRTWKDLYLNQLGGETKFEQAISNKEIYSKHNPWFDVYGSWNDQSGESLDSVSYNLIESAIPDAAELLVKQVRLEKREKQSK